MQTYATGDLQGPERPAEQVSNQRVTARIARNPDGGNRTIYAVDGREVGDRDDLRAALRGGR